MKLIHNSDFGFFNQLMGSGCPTEPHTFPLWGAAPSDTLRCRCLGSSSGKALAFRGRGARGHGEDHRNNAKTAEGLFWPFALYLIACFFKVNLLTGFFFYLVFSPAIPMRHSFLWVMHTIKKLLFGSKFCSHAWNQHFFQWEIGNELNLWVIHYLLFWPEMCFYH